MTTDEDARIRAKAKQATRPEKKIPLVLRGDLARQIEDLEEKLVEIRRKADTLAGDPRAAEIAAQIEALIEEARDSIVEVTIRGVKRKVWSDLKAKYPPSDPTVYLYDPKIFDEAVPLCWASPDISAEVKNELLEELTDGQWNRLCTAVQHVNGDVDVPFSALATRIRQASGASELQPEPTE